MAGIKKTTIRCTVVLPDNYLTIQRLYDYGTWFKLTREIISDADKAADFIEKIKARGTTIIGASEYIDDDDLKQKQSFVYELIVR